jgi:hypothetical protein
MLYYRKTNLRHVLYRRLGCAPELLWTVVKRKIPAPETRMKERWRGREKEKQDRQCKACSRNHCCCGKAISITYWFVCAYLRARACVHMDTRARGCVHVHTALLIQHSTRIRHIVTSFVAPMAPPYILTLSHKRCDFRKKKKFSNIKCLFLFSISLLSKTFLILRRIQRNIVKNVETSSCKVPVISVGF